MQELDKILEEMEEGSVGIGAYYVLKKYRDEEDLYVSLSYVKDIIRKHMNEGWIPVEERLPEVGEYVLGTNKYDEVLVYHYEWNSPHTGKMFFALCGSAATIIAWRPLPEPYRLERSEGE